MANNQYVNVIPTGTNFKRSSSGKRIEIDGKQFRVRRGKLVQIPVEWVGKCTDKNTIRKRKSKLIHKLRRGKPKPEKTNHK